jgi:hypothetical protein
VTNPSVQPQITQMPQTNDLRVLRHLRLLAASEL